MSFFFFAYSSKSSSIFFTSSEKQLLFLWFSLFSVLFHILHCLLFPPFCYLLVCFFFFSSSLRYNTMIIWWKKNASLVYRWPLWFIGTSWKWIAVVLSGTSLRAELWEMARWVIIIWITGFDQWFAWIIRDLEGTCLENRQQENVGKRYMDRSFRMDQKCEDICIPCVCSLKADLSREKIS